MSGIGVASDIRITLPEPQPLTSYRKAIHKNKTMENLKRNFENMKLSPDSFAGCLEEVRIRSA